MRKNLYLYPRGNSVMNRTWIPRYRRTVIGWDKHCRGRVINSREWNELPYMRKIQRLRHYFLIIISLNYLLFLLLLMFFRFLLFVFCFCFRCLFLSQKWTLFEINQFVRTNCQLFYVYLKHCFLCQHLDFSRRYILKRFSAIFTASLPQVFWKYSVIY